MHSNRQTIPLMKKKVIFLKYADKAMFRETEITMSATRHGMILTIFWLFSQYQWKKQPPPLISSMNLPGYELLTRKKSFLCLRQPESNIYSLLRLGQPESNVYPLWLELLTIPILGTERLQLPFNSNPAVCSPISTSRRVAVAIFQVVKRLNHSIANGQ